MLHSIMDRIWFGLTLSVAVFALLNPDRLIRILSYGKRCIADVPPWRVRLLRLTAAIMVAGCAVILVEYFRKHSDL